jgi:cytochrome c-type biogenesis protein
MMLAAANAEAGLRAVDPFAAFVGGLLSFLSPCVLAVVPGYIAYLGGASLSATPTRRALIGNAAIFVAGFSFVFILVYEVFRALLIHLPLAYQNVLTQVGAVIVIFLGLQFLGLIRIPWLVRETRLAVAHRLDAGTALSSALVGMTFALGWTPCVGPILTFILLRASARDIGGGTGLMLLYCAGLALPFMAAALLLDRARPAFRLLNRRARLVEVTAGGLLIVLGLLLFTGRFADVNQWFGPLARYLPQG